MAEDASDTSSSSDDCLVGTWLGLGEVNRLVVEADNSSTLPARSSCARECRMATKLLKEGCRAMGTLEPPELAWEGEEKLRSLER